MATIDQSTMDSCWEFVSPSKTRAIPATAIGMALWYRRSELRSELRDTRTIAPNPARWGTITRMSSIHVIRLMAGGLFDRFPKLRMVIGHMGEALPFWIDRLDNRYQWEFNFSGKAKPMKRLPSIRHFHAGAVQQWFIPAGSAAGLGTKAYRRFQRPDGGSDPEASYALCGIGWRGPPGSGRGGEGKLKPISNGSQMNDENMPVNKGPYLSKEAEYLRDHFHITTSGMNYWPQLKMTIDVMGIDRVMFAVDYPQEEHRPAVETIDNAPLSREDRPKFCYRNAERVFGIKA